MTPRFLADENLKRAIGSGVQRREPSVDFQIAQAAGLEGLDDSDVLAFAAREGRILVSHDFRTMPSHFLDFVSRQHSPGVFLISQRIPVSMAVETLVMIWAASDSSEWANYLTYLPL